MLRIHVLNVRHGDSIILEHIAADGTRTFALIDSNETEESEPKALTKLQALRAERLSYLCLTHPHADHFRGIAAILKAYSGRIDEFVIFPAGAIGEARVAEARAALTDSDIAVSLDGVSYVPARRAFDEAEAAVKAAEAVEQCAIGAAI